MSKYLVDSIRNDIVEVEDFEKEFSMYKYKSVVGDRKYGAIYDVFDNEYSAMEKLYDDLSMELSVLKRKMSDYRWNQGDYKHRE